MDKCNPITKVYDAIWDLLNCNPNFANLFREGNQLRFAGKKSETAITKLTSDLPNTGTDTPEIRIMPTGTIPHLFNTSNTSQWTERFSLQVSAGNYDIAEVLYPVKWAIFCALSNWVDIQKSLMGLEWNGKTFVRLVKPLTINDIPDASADAKRNMPGWATLWTIEVMMIFQTTDLQANG